MLKQNDKKPLIAGLELYDEISEWDVTLADGLENA